MSAWLYILKGPYRGVNGTHFIHLSIYPTHIVYDKMGSGKFFSLAYWVRVMVKLFFVNITGKDTGKDYFLPVTLYGNY